MAWPGNKEANQVEMRNKGKHFCSLYDTVRPLWGGRAVHSLSKEAAAAAAAVAPHNLRATKTNTQRGELTRSLAHI